MSVQERQLAPATYDVHMFNDNIDFMCNINTRDPTRAQMDISLLDSPIQHIYVKNLDVRLEVDNDTYVLSGNKLVLLPDIVITKNTGDDIIHIIMDIIDYLSVFIENTLEDDKVYKHHILKILTSIRNRMKLINNGIIFQ